jgi:REP element-mobilizing transposase RayT
MRDWFDTYRQAVLWSPSYFAASCGGAPRNTLPELYQTAEDAAQTF